MMMMIRPVLWLAAAFLILPLGVVVLYSFNEAETSPAIKGLTLRWYAKALERDDFREGMANSLFVSFATTVLSLAVGVSAALAGRFSPSPWTRRVLAAACVVPLLTPELLIALGSVFLFYGIGLERSLWTVVLGHTSFGVPLAFLLTDTALSSGKFDDLIRAARDLGAKGPAILRRVVMPLLWPYLVSSGVLIWALSIDEVVLSFFLCGNDRVITVRLFSLLHTKGVSAEINVACAILMVLVVSIWLAGGWIRRKFAQEVAV